MDKWFHFDPVTLIVLVGGFIGTWFSLKKDSSWHTKWIQKHSEECDEQRAQNNAMLTELQKTNQHLVTLTTGHHERLEKVDGELIRLRDRQDHLVDRAHA